MQPGRTHCQKQGSEAQGAALLHDGMVDDSCANSIIAIMRKQLKMSHKVGTVRANQPTSSWSPKS